ncbi:MAG: DNA-binding protein [Bacilli bacterium]|nr:DNA-binding protein [Bacilli bacterium]
MEEVLYFNELYDLYNGLLTDKQREYFEDYYFNNLSFSEMAENYEVSRNAIFKQIHIVTDKLKEYESILKLHEKRKKLEEIVKNIDNSELKIALEELI